MALSTSHWLKQEDKSSFGMGMGDRAIEFSVRLALGAPPAIVLRGGRRVLPQPADPRDVCVLHRQRDECPNDFGVTLDGTESALMSCVFTDEPQRARPLKVKR